MNLRMVIAHLSVGLNLRKIGDDMKDTKGHGSESRGGSAKAATDATRRAFTQKYGATGGTMESRGAPRVALAPGGHLTGNWDSFVGGARVGTHSNQADAEAHAKYMAGGAAPVGGGQPVASNAHAAATLASGPKSAPVATHSAMSPVDRNSAEYHSYNRDLALRSRNGQVGSGMKFRG